MTIRQLRTTDAPDLHHNCFSDQTLREVQDYVDWCLAQQAQGRLVPLVVEVEGHAVASGQLARYCYAADGGAAMALTLGAVTGAATPLTTLSARDGTPDWSRVAALVAVLLVILFGAVSLFRLPIQLTPEVERPTITINTSWRAAAPEEVEAEISAEGPVDESLVKQDLLALPLREAREQFERAYLQQQLVLCGGKVGKLAERVGMERTHLYRKLRSLGIDHKKGAE